MMDYILREAISQQDHGAHILDVNVGLPDIDEVEMMREVVMNLQSITSLPLQIDTVDQQAMEAAMRIYNGKPMVNSVNGKQESMDQVFPLIEKSGRYMESGRCLEYRIFHSDFHTARQSIPISTQWQCRTV